MFNTIKKSDEISELFKEGSFVPFKHFFVYYVSADKSQSAFIAGKKLGNSVTRNKLRRKLKRVYLEHTHWFSDKKAIIVAKNSLVSASDKDVKNNFERAIRRKIERNS